LLEILLILEKYKVYDEMDEIDEMLHKIFIQIADDEDEEGEVDE